MARDQVRNFSDRPNPTHKETLQDKISAAAMQIIADDRQNQRDQIAKLKAARIAKELADAQAPVVTARKPSKKKSGQGSGMA